MLLTHFQSQVLKLCLKKMPKILVLSLMITYLGKQIVAITKKCNMNLRDYWRIVFKLSQELKIQLVHAGVLSIIDYSNAVYGGLTEYDLQKLPKLQNSALRFIFGLLREKNVTSLYHHSSRNFLYGST